MSKNSVWGVCVWYACVGVTRYRDLGVGVCEVWWAEVRPLVGSVLRHIGPPMTHDTETPGGLVAQNKETRAAKDFVSTEKAS